MGLTFSVVLFGRGSFVAVVADTWMCLISTLVVARNGGDVVYCYNSRLVGYGYSAVVTR